MQPKFDGLLAVDINGFSREKRDRHHTREHVLEKWPRILFGTVIGRGFPKPLHCSELGRVTRQIVKPACTDGVGHPFHIEKKDQLRDRGFEHRTKFAPSKRKGNKALRAHSITPGAPVEDDTPSARNGRIWIDIVREAILRVSVSRYTKRIWPIWHNHCDNKGVLEHFSFKTGETDMFKRITTSFILSSLLGLGLMLPATATTISAATTATAVDTKCYYSSRRGRYVCYKKPGFYRRHRKLVNIAGGAAAGALVGGLIGGKRGAGIGMLAGAGGGYLVTKKQRPKHYTRRYYVYRRP